MNKDKFISRNAMDKIMREAGALRVSDAAKEALAEVLERKALELSKEAKRFAEHAGRKTITNKDILLAAKEE
jgi:DNA-binding protein